MSRDYDLRAGAPYRYLLVYWRPGRVDYREEYCHEPAWYHVLCRDEADVLHEVEALAWDSAREQHRLETHGLVGPYDDRPPSRCRVWDVQTGECRRFNLPHRIARYLPEVRAEDEARQQAERARRREELEREAASIGRQLAAMEGA